MRSVFYFCVWAVICLSATGQTSTQLVVDVRRIVNETAYGDATLLFDEQSTGTNSTPTNAWTTLWSTDYYPVAAIVDLAGKCHLADVAFFDFTGIGDLQVQALVSNVWVDLFTDPQDRYNGWVDYPVSVETRYLRIICHEINVIPPEVVLYGWRLESEEAYPSPVAPTPPTFDQFMGVNTIVIDPIGRMEAFGCLREYHDWDWDTGSVGYPNDSNQWFNSYTGGWNFDLFYRNLKLTGLLTVPCKQWSASWLGVSDSQHKPILASSGRDSLSPTSYVEHADHLFQFAARFGSTPVTNSLLKLSPSETRLSGLGYVNYIENWNEPDKWWKGREGLFLPAEYAAMSSADVDGHLGAMGSTVGIRTADPSVKFVMAGLIGINMDYLKSLKYWCDRNRAGNYPWDVINVHYYCNDAGGQTEIEPTVGISPEAGQLRAQAAALVDYRNRFLRDKEVWVSEFGYDVHPDSVQRAPAIGSTPTEEVQGCWIVRSFFALSAAGVDRAFLFMLSDPDTSNFTKFATSGLLTDRWQTPPFRVRPGWFYCKTLKERLTGLHYYADQSSGNTNVTIYQFADAANAIKAYAVWCPTTNNTTVSSYSLALAGSPSSATLVTLTNGYPVGLTNALTISSGHVTINVSEKPVLVLAEYSPAMRLPDGVFGLNTNMVTKENGEDDAGLLADEASLVGQPIYGQGGDCTTIWFPGWSGTNYPASAYIDFGEVIPITKLFLYDLNADGLVTVASGSPGHWQPLFDDDLRNYGSWNLHVLNVRTRYLRFTRDGGGNFGEVAVYTNTWVNQFAVPMIASLVLSNNGSVTLSGAGVPGSQIMFWATTNLLSGTWEPLTTNTIDTTGLWQLIDPVAPGVRQKFYKASSP